MQLLEFWGWIASPEAKLLDFFLWVGPRANSARSPRIVVVDIDDKSFQQCFKSSPMQPEKIGKVVQAALDANPAAVGVDIITDAEHLNYDSLPRDMRVVWAAGVEEPGREESESFWDWITGPKLMTIRPTKVLGKEPGDADVRWALPVYPREEDQHLRRFPRQMIVPTGVRLNWPSAVAQVYKPDLAIEADARKRAAQGHVDELFVAHTPRDVRWYRLTDVFACNGQEITLKRDSDEFKTFQKEAQDQIVLIGGTFASGRDFYETADGRISGLEMNANAVTAELTGTALTEMRPRYRFPLDIAVGLAIAAIFHRTSKSVNWRIGWSFGGVLITLTLAASILYQANLVWLSCAGIAIGMMLHVLIEIWREDLPGSEHSEH
jgi:hypothetical protein